MFDGRSNGACRARKRVILSEALIRLLELSHLPNSSPTEIAVAGVAQIQIRDLLEPACRVKARRQFVSDRLNVNKAICACRAYRLLVEMLGIELAAIQSGDLRLDQRGAAFEIIRAVLRP